jgi:hypothetical protein
MNTEITIIETRVISEPPKTPIHEKKPLVVPDAPKKPKTIDPIDQAITNGHITVQRGGGYWSRSAFDSDSEGDD